MANLDDYLARRRGAAASVAQRAGISQGTLSAIRTGRRRPSPELAKRIEKATEGEVRAASLLGLERTAPPRLQPLGEGQWLVWSGDQGESVVPSAVLQDLGIGPGEPVAFRKTAEGWVLTSARGDLRSVQELGAKFVRPGESIVDELIAERRENPGA